MVAEIHCQRCRRVGLAQTERILRGATEQVLHLCGTCEHSWTIDVTPKGRAARGKRRSAPSRRAADARRR